MTNPNDDMLDDVFAQARKAAPVPSDQLMARIFGDSINDVRFFRFGLFEFEGRELVVARSGYSKLGCDRGGQLGWCRPAFLGRGYDG